MKKKFQTLGLGVAALAAIALSLPAAVASSHNKIRIGVTIRMISDVGFKHGEMIQDEVDAINASGGINGNQIELILLNDECKSDKGVENANRLIFQEKVHLIIGSSCSSVTLPIVDVTAKGETPQIIPHSTNRQITEKGSAWVFRVPISSRFYKAVQAKYVAGNIGDKVAYIYGTDAAGKSFAEEMIAYMRENFNAEPVYQAQAQENEIDFRSFLLKAKDSNPDALVLAMSSGDGSTVARALVQSYEVGIPKSTPRVLSSIASKQEIPTLAEDAVVGVFYSAAFSAADTRPVAQLFTSWVKEKYGVTPDHDFSQAWDLMQIVKQALRNSDLKLTDDSLAADRTALRDALASVRNYSGLASGPISFCAAPTPQCRDGNRTPVLIQYTKGGADFQTQVLDKVTFDDSFGL